MKPYVRRVSLLILGESSFTFHQHGGFGNRPGFGLNTNKASIKLTFLFTDFLDAVLLQKHWRNGRAGLVFFSTELASSAATEFEDIWATHLRFIGGRALIAAKKDGLSWEIDPLFLQNFQSSGEHLKSVESPLLRWLRILPTLSEFFSAQRIRVHPPPPRETWTAICDSPGPLSVLSWNFTKIAGLQRRIE